jgi:hypothetical protein
MEGIAEGLENALLLFSPLTFASLGFPSANEFSIRRRSR